MALVEELKAVASISAHAKKHFFAVTSPKFGPKITSKLHKDKVSNTVSQSVKIEEWFVEGCE